MNAFQNVLCYILNRFSDVFTVFRSESMMFTMQLLCKVITRHEIMQIFMILASFKAAAQCFSLTEPRERGTMQQSHL